jgi:hypothetical protein
MSEGPQDQFSGPVLVFQERGMVQARVAAAAQRRSAPPARSVRDRGLTKFGPGRAHSRRPC